MDDYDYERVGGKRIAIRNRSTGRKLTPQPFVLEKSHMISSEQPNWILLNFLLEWNDYDRLCGLVVRVPGCRTYMYCVSCEVRTEFINVMQEKVDRLCGLVIRVPGYITEMYCVSCEV
jgi:hypothetical protein